MDAQLRRVFGLALLFALVFGTISAERAVAQTTPLPAESCPTGDTIMVDTDTFLTVEAADAAARADSASERERTMQELFDCAIANPGSTLQFADGAYDDVRRITIGNSTNNDGDDSTTPTTTEKVTFQGNSSDREAVKFTGEVNFRVRASNILIRHITFENIENVGTLNWPRVTETFEIEQEHLDANECRENVEIRNCVFRNTRSNGVSYHTGGSKTCDSDGFIVADSLFENIGYNNNWEEDYGPGDVGSGIPKITLATITGTTTHMTGSTPHHVSGSHTSGIRITGDNTITNVRITGNTIDGTTHSGMLVHRVWGDSSDKVEISNNIVNNVPKSGIHVLQRPTGTTPEYDLDIKNNFVVNSGNSPWLVTDYGWYANGLRGQRYSEIRSVINDSGEANDREVDRFLKPEIWSYTENIVNNVQVKIFGSDAPPLNIYDKFGGPGFPAGDGREVEYSINSVRLGTKFSPIPASEHNNGAFTRNRARFCIPDDTSTSGVNETHFACFSVVRFLDPHAFGAIHLTGVSTDGDVEIMENELRDNTLGLLLCGGGACYFDDPYAALGAYYNRRTDPVDITEPDIIMNNIYGQSRISTDDRDELPSSFASGAVYASIGDLTEKVVLNGNYLGTNPALFTDPVDSSLSETSAYSLAGARLDIQIPIALITATADGDTLTLTYSKTLDSGSVPAARDFAVMVDGTLRGVSGVSVSGAAVVLTLASAVEAGDEVTVSYTLGTNPIRAMSTERNTVSLTNSRVSIGPPPPTITTAAVVGNTLTLTYNENLDSGSMPAASDFTVRVGGSTGPAVTGVAVSGAAVTLTLASAVEDGDTVTVSYAPGSNPIRNAAGVNAVALTSSAVTNNTPPALTTAVVNRTTLTLTYSKTLDSGSVPATSDFTVMVGDEERGVDAVSVSGAAVTLTLASAVAAGDAVIVSYTPGTNPIRNAAEVNAVALTDRAVTNNTPRPRPRGPVQPTPLALTSAAVAGDTLTLTYNKTLDSESVPAASDFTVMVDGEERDISMVSVSGATVTLTLASAVAARDAVTVSYTPGDNPIRDASGANAAALTDDGRTPVSNNTSRPGPPGGGGSSGGGGGCALASGGSGVGLGMLFALMVVPFGVAAGGRAREAR